MTDTLESVFRAERAAILAVLARRLGDLELAEDAFQDALARAAARWPADGVPGRPGAWLTVVAWRSALDRRRREHPRGAEQELEDLPGAERAWTDLPVEDDRLALILACCHPALAPEDRVALTLRHVVGLTDREVAAGFVVATAAMTKRLVRARRKLRDAGISFALPLRDELPSRMDAARAVITLVFSQGYLSGGDGPPIRDELCDEAAWLAEQLLELRPEDPETIGLLAMILLHAARRPARLDARGGLVAFADQDPGRWDRAALERARALLARTGHSPPGPYRLQAAIAAVQTFAAADGRPVPWHHVDRLYAALARQAPTPVVDVNRAVAAGHARGPEAGLAILAEVEAGGRLRHYAPFHAARADLLERAGRPGPAAEAWARAIGCADNPTQRARLAQLARRRGA